MTREDPWEVIQSYSSPMEAQIALSYLKSNGIEAMLFDENASRILPHMSLIISCRLVVKKSQIAEAKLLLANMQVSEADLNEEFEKSLEKTPEKLPKK